MALKRKRSVSNSPASSTSTSTLTYSPHVSTAHGAAPPSHPSPTSPHASRTFSEQNESGRTMKRTRDNRPDDASIHEHTMQMLYSGQRRAFDMFHDTPSESLTSHEEEPPDGFDAEDQEMQLESESAPLGPEKGQKSLGAFFAVGGGSEPRDTARASQMRCMHEEHHEEAVRNEKSQRSLMDFKWVT